MICLLVCSKKSLIGPARVLSSSPRCFSCSPADYFGASGPCQAPVHHVGTRPFFQGRSYLVFLYVRGPGNAFPPV